MPRTTTLECPGCPPIRALTFDSLGLIKVIEARDKEAGIPKVVERWGEPDSSKGILAASIDYSKSDPLLALARNNGMIEVLSPISGQLIFSISGKTEGIVSPEDDPVIGLHLFKRQRLEPSTRSCTLLTCTTKGNACLRSVEVADPPYDLAASPSKKWNVCNSGIICCSKVDASEKYSIFGGKGVEISMWDLENSSKIWTAKSPLKNNLGMFTPTWFTSLTYLSKDDHRKFVAGTNSHEVRLYDISAQRRPVLSVPFRESPIKAIAEDTDGHTIYIGNGTGDLASIDTRTGRLVGCYSGKCSGSIKSIVRHLELPVIASCGLDSYLRFWDIHTRQLLSAVYLKQHLISVVLDSNFCIEVTEAREGETDQLQDEHRIDENNRGKAEEELKPEKRKKVRQGNSIHGRGHESRKKSKERK